MGARELTFLPFPFTLAYAAAVLESKGMPVLVLDAIGEDLREDEYYRRICEFQPDLIINETSTASFDRDALVARQLKDLTGATIVFCGPHSSGIHEAYCVIRQ